MKDYYDHTRNIFQITERITQQFATGESSEGSAPSSTFCPFQKPMRNISKVSLAGTESFTRRSETFSPGSLSS